MKLLDKKRIKAKKGEYLAVNERNMLAKVYICICSRMLAKVYMLTYASKGTIYAHVCNASKLNSNHLS